MILKYLTVLHIVTLLNIVKSCLQDFGFAILSSAENIEPLKYIEDHRP